MTSSDMKSKEQITKNMQAIKSKDTKIELILRKQLWKRGIRYRKNLSSLIGIPDIVLTKYKIAIFCDSEFWHGYDWENRRNEIKSNNDFWINKIQKNIERDRFVSQELESSGWMVIRFWGKEILNNSEECIRVVEDCINQRKRGG